MVNTGLAKKRGLVWKKEGLIRPDLDNEAPADFYPLFTELFFLLQGISISITAPRSIAATTGPRGLLVKNETKPVGS